MDLTKKKVETIERISQLLKRKKLGFAFADVNCRLCVRIGEEFRHINSEDELHDIIREYDERSDRGDDANDDYIVGGGNEANSG